MGIKDAHRRIKDRKITWSEAIAQIKLENDPTAQSIAEGMVMGLGDALEIIENECPEVLELPNLIGVTEVPHGLFYKAVKKVVEDVLEHRK